MTAIYFTPAADADLDQIWEYIAEDNIPAANRLLENIEQALLKLARFPHLGTSRNEITPGLRVLPLKPISIFYFIQQDQLLIARIAYAGRNIDQAFVDRTLQDND